MEIKKFKKLCRASAGVDIELLFEYIINRFTNSTLTAGVDIEPLFEYIMIAGIIREIDGFGKL